MKTWIYPEGEPAREITDLSLIVGIKEYHHKSVCLENDKWLKDTGDGRYYDDDDNLWLQVFRSESPFDDEIDIDSGECVGIINTRDL